MRSPESAEGLCRRGAAAGRWRGAVPVLLLAAASAAAAAQAPPDGRRSGYQYISRATQALQDDDTLNPAMLWVAGGEMHWRAGDQSCAGCHGDDPRALRGVAARYPAYDERERRPLTLAQRINACRTRHQGGPAWAAASEPLLSLEALLGHASRGVPIAAPSDPRLAAELGLGERLFHRRFGQLALACADCHDRLAGRRLAGSLIPQAHPTGYPIYRLEWQGLGGLERRMRGCLTGIRAEPWPDGAREWVALEVFLKHRAAGMPVETPAVRP